MNLYLVYTNTMSIYVLAKSFDEAKNTVEEFLHNENYDWTKNREVIKIELIATETVYPNDDNYKLILVNNKISNTNSANGK